MSLAALSPHLAAPTNVAPAPPKSIEQPHSRAAVSVALSSMPVVKVNTWTAMNGQNQPVGDPIDVEVRGRVA